MRVLLLISITFLLLFDCSISQIFDEHQYDFSMKDISAEPILSETAQDDGTLSPHDSDNEPMVYETPSDYATWARQRRDRLIASGTDPTSIILQSELPNHIPPPQENETPADFAQRYSETMNGLIRRGVSILNDMCIADVVASTFSTAEGRVFDLGPGSGATKGEFREFGKWFAELEQGWDGPVPEKWLKFEKPSGWEG